MPRGDGTGPMGMGSMTGRGAGYCAGARQTGYGRGGLGRGQNRGRYCPTTWGLGQGYGGGFRRGIGPSGGMGPGTQAGLPQTEKQRLHNQATMLQAQLEQINKQLNELEHCAREQNEGK